MHSFTWRSRFSSVPGLFPCQTLWEEFSSLSKELNFSLLFSFLTFPDQAHTFLLELFIFLLLPHSCRFPFPFVTFRFPPARFPFLTSLFRLFLFFTHIIPPPHFWLVFFRLDKIPISFISRTGRCFHMFYINLCACA